MCEEVDVRSRTIPADRRHHAADVVESAFCGPRLRPPRGGKTTIVDAHPAVGTALLAVRDLWESGWVLGQCGQSDGCAAHQYRTAAEQDQEVSAIHSATP